MLCSLDITNGIPTKDPPQEGPYLHIKDPQDPLKTTFWSCGLFSAKFKARDSGLFKALQSSKKLVRGAWDDASWDEQITPHLSRGILVSKVLNLGMCYEQAILRGRWSRNSTSVRKYYYNFQRYRESSARNLYKSSEELIRLKVTYYYSYSS